MTQTQVQGHGVILTGWYKLHPPETVASGDRFWHPSWQGGYWLPVTHSNLQEVRDSGSAIIRRGNGGPA